MSVLSHRKLMHTLDQWPGKSKFANTTTDTSGQKQVRNGEPSQEGHAKNITNDPLYALKSCHLIRRGKSRIDVLLQRHEASAIRGGFKQQKFEGRGLTRRKITGTNHGMIFQNLRQKKAFMLCQVATDQGKGHQHHHRQNIRESYRQI